MGLLDEFGEWVDKEIVECERRIKLFGDDYTTRKFYVDRKTTLLEVKGRVMLITREIDD